MSTNKNAAQKQNAQVKPSTQAKPPVGTRPSGTTTKPIEGKTTTTARPTNGQPRTTAARAAQTRPGTAKKRGFRLRPLDLVVTAIGLVIVGFIVWGGLSATLGKASTGTSTEPGRSNPNFQPNITPIPAGNPATGFNLPATDGKTYTLDQFKGKDVVLLEFMAPWCPHCQDDAPMMESVWQAYKNKGVQALGISASPYGRNYESGDKSPITMADLTWFRDNFKVTYPLLYDKNTIIADNYGIQYFPTLYIVDKQGNVANMLMADTNNPLTQERISAAIDAVLNQK